MKTKQKIAQYGKIVRYFESKSNPLGPKYAVRQLDENTFSCNCRGWTFKRGDNPRSCRHTKAVENCLNR